MRCLVLSVSVLEASLVLAGRQRDQPSWLELDELVAHTGIEIVAQDRTLAELAREAFRRFGEGRHPAALNLGDCAAYALAKAQGLPLLFKGADSAGPICQLPLELAGQVVRDAPAAPGRDD